MLYKKYDFYEDNYSLVKNYLVRDLNISKGRPIIWIYIPSVPNSRKIKSFGDGTNTMINQDYLHLTIKSIINTNPSFTICVIDNYSFNKIIPGWEYDLNVFSQPILNNMLQLAMSKLLYIYGGMIVPLSFLCFKDLTPLYEHGTHSGIFICENVNKSIRPEKFVPDPTFMGCLPNDPTMFQYSLFCETVISDTSEESKFLGVHSSWFYQKNVTIISGEKIGIKTFETEITVEMLLSTTPIYLNDSYGIYIPAEEILQKHDCEWFAYLSKKEVLMGNTNIQNYILLTSAEQCQSWTPFWKFLM
jgi:hypothetical protein